MDDIKNKSEKELYGEAQSLVSLQYTEGWRILRQSLDQWVAEAAKAEDDYLESEYPARDDILRLSLRRKDRQDLLAELDASFDDARKIIDQYNKNKWADSFYSNHGRWPEAEEYERAADTESE